jgi:hypothetical protein
MNYSRCPRVWLALLLLVVPGLTSAQTLTQILPDKFRDLTTPFDARMVTHFFGAARPPAGESVALRAAGSVLLHLHRGATQLPDGARVTLAVLGATGSELKRWNVNLDPVTAHGFIRRVDLPAETMTISVVAVDRAEGGPTGRPPYTLILEAWPLNAQSTVELPADAAAGGLQESGPAVPTVSCRMVGSPSKREDHLEKFASFSLAGMPTDIAVQKLVSAGGYLLISPPAGLMPGEELTARLLVKFSGDGPYQEVCPHMVLRGGATQSLEATHTGKEAYSIWRVEFRLPKLPQQLSKARIDFTRERVMVPPDPFRGEPGWNNARGLVCFDRDTQFQGIMQSANAFAGRTRLNVVLPASGSVAISDAERLAAETAVLQAAALWVYSCIACKPDNLAVVSVNGKVYVSQTLYALVGPSRGFVAPPPLDPLAAEEMLVSFLGSARVGTRAPFLPYRRTEDPKGDFDRVCTAKASETATPTLKRVQDALCSTASVPGTSASIRVTFKLGDTACGDESEVIGCRADHELTQYNVRDFRFSSTHPISTSIGNGRIEVDLLQAVVHEMGHWIGIEHLGSGESIMAASLEQSRCIDFQTVKAVAEQTMSPTAGMPDGPQPFVLRRGQKSK